MLTRDFIRKWSGRNASNNKLPCSLLILVTIRIDIYEKSEQADCNG